VRAASASRAICPLSNRPLRTSTSAATHSSSFRRSCRNATACRTPVRRVTGTSPTNGRSQPCGPGRACSRGGWPGDEHGQRDVREHDPSHASSSGSSGRIRPIRVGAAPCPARGALPNPLRTGVKNRTDLYDREPVPRRAAWADTVASFLYPAGAFSAVVVYLTGRQAAATVLIPGMAHLIVQQHWNWALATTISFAIVALVRLWTRFRRPRPHRAIRTALVGAALVALVLLFQTGEHGARLVYERGVGAPGLARSR